MEENHIELMIREEKMQDNTNNKDFWNSYVTYWENKVEQANMDENANDKTNDDRILENYFKKLQVDLRDKLLDYGCGSGRLYPIYKNIVGFEAENYVGIDISDVSLEHASKFYAGLEVNKNLFEFDGVHIPFKDNCFDKIICFGVFDACNQELVIRELLRVLKKQGILLVTGKNNRYYVDDEAAAVAEVNARKKGHPNYFTDVYSLMEQLQQHGVVIREKYFFLRRGDFPKNKVASNMPEKFYEWAFLLQKSESYQDYEYDKFSELFSSK